MNTNRDQAHRSESMAGRFRPEWITLGIDKECVVFTDEFGEHLNSGVNKLSTSQIRNVFGEIKRIELRGFKSDITSFFLLKPKMAYAASRQSKGAKINDFKLVFDKAFDALDPNSSDADKQFRNFVDFFEAILAYHKAHGGN